MKKITITSSSNILPHSSFWKTLEKKNKLLFSEFSNWPQTLINTDVDQDIVLVLFAKDFGQFIDDKNLNKNLNLIEKLIEDRLKTSHGLNVLLFSSYFEKNILDTTRQSTGFNDQISSFFNKLYRLSEKYNNFIFSNLDQNFSLVGFENCFDYRNWYLARCHLSIKGMEIISNIVEEIIYKRYFSPKKILILDCDNTLWGGVLGEDGIEGIQISQDGIGKAFEDFQRNIKKISENGTLLALASKNNENDVFDVLKNHRSMILKKDDITISKINWNEKADNILELSKDLNLGLDSMVFWDDNPIEREKIKIRIPELTVIDPPENTFDWPNYLSNLNYFSKFKITEEDKKKKEQYKIRSEFVDDKKKFNTETDYLKSINLQPKLIEISNDNLSRASQLSLKTNQFNFRTIRYTENQIQEKINNKDNIIFMISLNDIYGDHGNIGLVCLTKSQDSEIFLENFLMSCRVIGRYLEFWIFRKIFDICLNKGFGKLKVEHLKTKKNNMIEDFLKKLITNKDILYDDNKCILDINLENFNVPYLEPFSDK